MDPQKPRDDLICSSYCIFKTLPLGPSSLLESRREVLKEKMPCLMCGRSSFRTYKSLAKHYDNIHDIDIKIVDCRKTTCKRCIYWYDIRLFKSYEELYGHEMARKAFCLYKKYKIWEYEVGNIMEMFVN